MSNIGTLIRTPWRDFASEGFTLFTSNIWMKETEDGCLLRVLCTSCRSIIEHEIPKLEEGQNLQFECNLCHTWKRFSIPKSKKIFIVESPDTIHKKRKTGIAELLDTQVM